MLKSNKITKQALNNLSQKLNKKNKFRSIIIGIGIILTTLLITMVFTVSLSLANITKKESIKQIGTCAEGAYKGITEEQYEKLLHSELIEDISYCKYLGRGTKAEFGQNSVEIRYIEEKAAEWNFCSLQKGHFPKEKNEIVIDDLFMEYSGQEFTLNDSVSINVEIGEKTVPIDFVISGIYKGNRALGTSLLYTSKEMVDEQVYDVHSPEEWDSLDYSNGKIDAFCRLKSTTGITDYMKEVWTKCELQGEAIIGENWVLSENTWNATTVLCILGIVLIIIISGYLMIYTIFYIAITNDTSFYGGLKVIGADSGQIKLLLHKQVSKIAVIAIPLGLLIGWISGNFCLPLVMKLMSSQVEQKFHFYPSVFIFSVLFTVLTILLSMYKPLAMLDKIAPIHTLQFTGLTDAKDKEINARKFSIHRFAFRNILRNKKKTILILLSLSLVMAIFTISACLLKSINYNKFILNAIPNDIYVSSETFLTDYEPKKLDEKVLEYCQDIPEAAAVDPYYYQKSLHVLNSEAKKCLENYWNSGSFDNDEQKDFIEEVVHSDVVPVTENRFYMTDHSLEKLTASEGKIDLEKFKTGDYVILFGRISDVDGISLYYPGDKILLYDWKENTKAKKASDGTIVYENIDEKEYEVMAIVNPLGGLINAFGGEISLFSVLPTSELNAHGQLAQLFSIGIDTEKISTIKQELDGYKDKSDFAYISIDDKMQEYQNLKLVFSLMCGGMTLVIGIMSIINFFNQCITGILERRKEFATLHAIGMTHNQLISMVVAENAYVLLGGIITGTVLGLVAGKLGITTLQNSILFLEFSCNWMPVLILIILLLILVNTMPGILYKKIILT